MVNHIPRDSTNDVYLNSQETGNVAPTHTHSGSATPKAKTAEIYNQSVNSPKNENKAEKKLIGEASAQSVEESAPITTEMLDEMANALQYRLPIIDIIRKAPMIINTQLNNGMLPLHFAIHYGETEDVELLLQVTELQLKDANGFDAFDHAVQAENNALAKKIMLITMKEEWTAVQKSCDTVQVVHEENPALLAILNGYPEEAYPQVIQNIQSNALNGGSSHNSLLVRTIKTSDYKGFLRAIMAGADFKTQDPKTGETLLHLAMKAGQDEIAYFLLDVAPKLYAAKDFQGVTPLQIAETNKKTQLLDHLYLLEKKHALEAIEANLVSLDKNNSEIGATLATLEESNSEIESKLGTMENNKPVVEAELEALAKSKTGIAVELETLITQKAQIEAQHEILEKTNAQIGTKLEVLKKSNSEIQAVLKDLNNSKISIWDSVLAFFFSTVPKKTTLEQRLEILKKYKSGVETELKTLKINQTNIQANLEILEKNNPEIGSKLEILQKNNTDIDARIDVLEKSKIEIETQLPILKKNKLTVKTELETLKKNKTEIEVELENLKKDKVEVEAKLEILNENKAQIDAQLEALDKNIKKYSEDYKAILETLSDLEKLQLHYVAKHGVMPHSEGSQGHNQYVLGSIINQDLEQLVLLANLGVPLNSTSIPADKALEDPMSYGATFRAIQESNSETLKGLKGKVWKGPAANTVPGQGKSLLDMAVHYAKDGEGEQKSLEIIAYLIGLGLDPMRINDEGESPFSMALLKGNYKAALLMIKDLEANDALLDRTYLLLKEGSKLRDPLAVSSSKSTQALFAAAFLLTSMYAGNSVLSYINFIPFVFSAFSGLVSSGPSCRDKLMAKGVEPIYYPELVKQAAPLLGKAMILELGVMPQNTIAMLSMTALGVYSSAVETFRSVKTAANHVAERPFSAAYKVAADALPLASTAMRFKTMFNNMFFAANTVKPVKPKLECKEVNQDDYKNMTTVERVSDESLNPDCRKHAKILLSANWDDKQFLKAKLPDLYVKKMFNKEVLGIHPDKGGDAAVFRRFAQAKETLLTPKDLPGLRMIAPPVAPFSLISTINSIPYKGVVLDTAVKAGVVWGTSTSTFQENVPGAKYLWPAMSMGSMGYVLGKGLYGAGQSVYSRVVG